MESRIPIINVKGTPFECGEQYGSQAKDLIRTNVNVYFDVWRSLYGLERATVHELCKKLVPAIDAYDADLLEEMRGIASGADIPVEDIIAINARYEINYTFGTASEKKADGCTSIVALPQVTKDGHTLIGQNWDYLPEFQHYNVILQVEQEAKPNVVTQPEAGNLAHRGMNSVGVGVCFNGLSSTLDNFDYSAPPYLIMIRGILNAANYSQAIGAVTRAKATLSGNFLIATRGGEAIDLEASPSDVACLYPEDGLLVHSNNFLVPSPSTDRVDILKKIWPDTLVRWHRAQELMKREGGQIGVDSFQRVLRDHLSYPVSICRHPDEQVEGFRQMATLASMIMDLDEGSIYIAEGLPCENEYYKLTPEILKE